MKQFIMIIILITFSNALKSINYYTIFGNDYPDTYGAEDYAITYDQIINGKLSNIYTKEMNGNEVFYLQYIKDLNTLVMINRMANTSKFTVTTYNTSTNIEKSVDITSDHIFRNVYIDMNNMSHLILTTVLNDISYYFDYNITSNTYSLSQNYDISSFDFLLFGNPYIKSAKPNCLFGYYLNNKFVSNNYWIDLTIDVTIPKDLVQIDYTKRMNWMINNAELSTYIVNLSDDNASYINNDILILDKKNNTFMIKTIPDSFINLRSTNGWIFSEKEIFFNETESPGKTERDAIASQFGEFKWAMFDNRRSFYYPGTLMLYHPATDRTIYIETNQGDSEILLVQNDYVYYRVLDKIFKAKIKGNTLGTPVKIAQDPKIAEVHWLIVEGEEE